MDELIKQRAELAERMVALDTGAFPGSKAWMAYNAACKAVSAFDAAHPEVAEELKRRSAERSARALASKDIGGL